MILTDLCAAHGFQPDIAFNSGNHQVVRRLVAAGVPLPERGWGSDEVLAALRRHGVP